MENQVYKDDYLENFFNVNFFVDKSAYSTSTVCTVLYNACSVCLEIEVCTWG